SAEATKNAIEYYTNKAFSVLETLNISEDKKNVLKQFGTQLMNRDD
ncbi:MAG: polyprenyl synthetase family protein, partial [Deltaproteobacteria bacterium]